MASRPLVLLAEPSRRQHHYRSVLDPAEFDLIEGREEALRHNPDLVIVTDEWFSENAVLIGECRRRRIPSLHVIDGIIEWKNTFENPRSLDERSGLPLFQPVLSDKIACLGRAQARVLESWGNQGVCEVVGAPRFDSWLASRTTRGRNPGTCRILVATATTPYFQENQRVAVLQSLHDLDDFFRGTAAIDDVSLEVVWRLPEPVRADSGLPGSLTDSTGRELAELLRTVDAAIITPSTCVLEAMLAGIPVAALDYPNTPHFVPTAWRIGAREHLETVIGELVAPSEAKLLFQDFILHDQLECATPAGPRLLALIREMVRLGRERRFSGDDLVFPASVLPRCGLDTAAAEERADLGRLYPGHPIFAERRVDRLAAEIGHLRRLLQIHDEDGGYCRYARNQLPEVERELQQCRDALAAAEARRTDTEQRLAGVEQARAESEKRYLDASRRCAERDMRCQALARERTVLAAAVSGRPIVIWGAGEGGRRALAWLERDCVSVSLFVDADLRKHGQLLDGLRIESPETLVTLTNGHRPFVLIGSVYRQPIVDRLRQWGYRPTIDFA